MSTVTQEPAAEPTTSAAPTTSATPAAPAAEPVKPAAAEPKADEGTLIGRAKAEEAPKATPQAPEKYEFTMPDGVQVDEALLGKATPLFKELDLSQENAQKVVSWYADVKKAEADNWNKEVNGWKQAVMKEHGPKTQETMTYVAKFIDKLGGPRGDAIRQLLDDTGLGNHPDLVYLFGQGGKAISEDTFVPGSNRNQPLSEEARARKMFPNTKYS